MQASAPAAAVFVKASSTSQHFQSTDPTYVQFYFYFESRRPMRFKIVWLFGRLASSVCSSTQNSKLFRAVIKCTVKMSILCQNKHDFQLQIQHQAFVGLDSEAGCAVRRIPVKGAARLPLRPATAVICQCYTTDDLHYNSVMAIDV